MNVIPHIRRIRLLGLALCLAAGVFLTSATASPPASGANAVTAWNAHASDATIAACILGGYGPQEARMYAMMHVAIHDALNGIDRRSRPYAASLTAAPGSSPEAAVAAAARDVLVTVLGSFSFFLPANCANAGIASVEDDYSAALGTIPNGTAKTRGVALGRAAAAAILALRSADGFDTPTVDPNYQEGSAPGEYRYTPGTPFAFAPHLAEDLTPFVLKDASQFRPGPPYSLTSRKYAADVNEIQRLGGDDVTTPSARTDEQTEIGLFWADTSPLMWNRITRAVSSAEGLDLWESARVFGLLNLALTDGYIGTWETKYHYRFWRPVTAIRLADIDGNAATNADPTWTPLLETPPIPDYDSGHAVEGGAAAQVLTRFFHTNTMSFSACSLTLPAGERCSDPSPTLRHFTSFSQAADENAVSASTSASTSGTRSRRGRTTARRSATKRPTTSCGAHTEAHHAAQRGPAERGLAHLQGRSLSRSVRDVNRRNHRLAAVSGLPRARWRRCSGSPRAPSPHCRGQPPTETTRFRCSSSRAV